MRSALLRRWQAVRAWLGPDPASVKGRITPGERRRTLTLAFLLGLAVEVLHVVTAHVQLLFTSVRGHQAAAVLTVLTLTLDYVRRRWFHGTAAPAAAPSPDKDPH